MHPSLQELPESPLSGARIWQAQVESLSNADLDEIGGCLDQGERARAARFHFEPDRNAYTATRGLLRSLLGTLLNAEASKLVFEYSTRGKPALASTDKEASALRFNVSHSTGWAMFAISFSGEVGIDLEASGRLRRNEENLSQLATRLLSPKELIVWRELSDAPERLAAFLRAWARKEAYAKATGRGLTEETLRIDVALDAAAPKSSFILRTPALESEVEQSWILHDLTAPEGFAAAIAVQEKLCES